MMFDIESRAPYSAALGAMMWKPMAVYIGGSYLAAYSDATDDMLGRETSKETNLHWTEGYVRLCDHKVVTCRNVSSKAAGCLMPW